MCVNLYGTVFDILRLTASIRKSIFALAVRMYSKQNNIIVRSPSKKVIPGSDELKRGPFSHGMIFCIPTAHLFGF